MAQITITEALAELKLIQKRIEKKQEFVNTYLFRQDVIRDPFEKDGGSAAKIQSERQAISDLEARFVNIRTAIQRINQTVAFEIEGTNKTIAEWLTWRKEVSSGQRKFLNDMRLKVTQARTSAQQKGFAVVSGNQTANNFSDVIINVDEGELAKQAEQLEVILGRLDGQLSLKNATIAVEV